MSIRNIIQKVEQEYPAPESGGGGITDAPLNGELYGRKDGTWEEAVSPDDLPSTLPTFIYESSTGIDFIVGDIPDDWKAFSYDIEKLYLGNSVTTIGDSAFDACANITGELVIPNSVTTIGNRAFFSCYNFTGDLAIPDSVTSIGDYAFSTLISLGGYITLGNGVTTIGMQAFSYNYFTGNLIIPDSVTTIGDGAFRNCFGLTSLTLGNSVTTIGSGAFSYCAFTSVTIPDSVTSIGNSAFGNNFSLSNVDCYTTQTAFVDTDAFINTADPLTIHARATDATWTEGTGLSFQGNDNVTVIKDL